VDDFRLQPGETSGTCVLDRVLHHSITINIKGESYRLKEKVKDGIVQRKEPKE
jgi:DNA replication protein DnaC